MREDDETTAIQLHALLKLKGYHKSHFKKEWKNKWPFISCVSGLPHHLRCNVCSKELSCNHQGIKDVKDHIATQGH